MIRFIKTCLFYLFFLGITCWLIGFFIFSGFAISLKYQPVEKADAIIALTGGSDRIREAIKLLQEDEAPRLFISGVNETVTGYHLLKEVPKELSQRIELGYQAKTTRMNAFETADWVHKNNIQSIILVTSFYHMPRSLFEIRTILPNLKIIPHAVFPHSFDQDTSWLHTRYAWQLFLEYHKFLVVYFFKGAVK